VRKSKASATRNHGPASSAERYVRMRIDHEASNLVGDVLEQHRLMRSSAWRTLAHGTMTSECRRAGTGGTPLQPASWISSACAFDAHQPLGESCSRGVQGQTSRSSGIASAMNPRRRR